MKNILVLNGPNLNLLEERDQRLYGGASLDDIEAALVSRVGERARIEFFQSNSEGELITKLHEARGQFVCVIINPGGLTHYSVSLRDALELFDGVKIEVHLSNILARERMRRRSVTAEACDAVVAGGGVAAYEAALELALLLSERRMGAE
jgi:3-dehydroquinate dehydratase-2